MNRIEEAIHKAKSLKRAREGAESAARSEAAPRPRALADGAGRAPPLQEAAFRSLAVDRGALAASGLWLDPTHARRLADEFRIAKRAVLAEFARLRLGAHGAPRVLTVTSALAGEGKSFSSFHLACSFALERELHVLLIDGDSPHPTLSRALGCDGRPGLLDCLESGLSLDEAVYRTDVERLWFLPAGHSTHGASELIASPRMPALIEAAGARIGQLLVVIDSPPMLQTVEARALVDVAQQTLLVVRANSTPEGALLQALDHLGRERPVQLLLNQREPSPLDEYQYYYSYPAGGYGGDSAGGHPTGTPERPANGAPGHAHARE